MRYISATTGALIVLPVFILLALIIPKHDSLPSVELILTVSTFLFAIISGFYIARLATRYDQIRNLLRAKMPRSCVCTRQHRCSASRLPSV